MRNGPYLAPCTLSRTSDSALRLCTGTSHSGVLLLVGWGGGGSPWNNNHKPQLLKKEVSRGGIEPKCVRLLSSQSQTDLLAGLSSKTLTPPHHLFLNREGRPLGVGELQACPFPDVVFPPLLCLPCLLPPFTVACKMVLARPDERET